RTKLPTGTINRAVYDGLGRLVSTWVGTNDTPGNGQEWAPTNNTPPANMIQTAGYVYDGGGVGDSTLTQVTRFSGGSDPARVSQTFYDWRDRAVANKSGVQSTEDTTTPRPIIYRQLDNLGEVVAQDQYDGDGVTIAISNGVPVRPAANLLRAHQT